MLNPRSKSDNRPMIGKENNTLAMKQMTYHVSDTQYLTKEESPGFILRIKLRIT